MNQSQCLKAMTGSGIDDFTQDDKTIERSRTTPNLRMHDEASMRQILRQYFMDTYDTYESIFECLTCEEAFYPMASNPELTKKIDLLAKQNNCTITGSGYQDIYCADLK